MSGDKHHKHSHDLPANGANNGAAANGDDDSIVVPHCVGCSDDPVGELEEWQLRAEEEERERKREDTVASNPSSQPRDSDDEDTFEDDRLESGGKSVSALAAASAPEPAANSQTSAEGDAQQLAQTGAGDKEVSFDIAHRESRKLVRMGINTALAIGIHNFPEGLATFVAALDDPAVGAVLAIAIGIHNIPEGLCVALPIYYATGNRWKAFMWACLSGVSEPIGALLGWIVLANTMSDDLYAILFGLVGGMMVIISAKELLPTAHRYDPEDTVVTYSMIAGMIIMAVSLVLFMA